MAWLVFVGVLGLAVGWIIRGMSSPSRRDLADYGDRAQRAERRLRSVRIERDDEHATVLTLRAALRSERQLLDGVANHSGVDRETFRKTVSKEYLGRELVVSPASLVDFDFGTNTAAEAEVASLQRLLQAKDAQLSEAREQIHRIRADVESLAMAGGSSNASASDTSSPASVSTTESGALLNERLASVPIAEPTTSAGTSTDGSATGNRWSQLATAEEVTLDIRDDQAVIDLCDSSQQGRPPRVRRQDAPRSVVEPDSASTAISADHRRFLEERAAAANRMAEEVASLRARLADTAVAKDNIRSRIEYRRSLDSRLAEIVSELEALRLQAMAEKPPAVPDEDSDAVL